MDDVPSVRGFRFAGVTANIKKNGKPDLGAIVADEPAAAAALFTTNIVKAAPVLVAAERLRRGRARAVLVNAGCANACTGDEGLAAARSTTAMLATSLGIDARTVIPASTGVIGAQLPVAKFETAMPSLVADLAPGNVLHFADAICTTDRWRKVNDARARIGGAEVTALGVAKGAGMIHPNMATTLLFVVTDANVAAPVLRRALKLAASDTINAVSVDGDTSTNDMLLALASARAEMRPVRGPKETAQLVKLLSSVLEPLSKSIAADGEGSEHLVTVDVKGLVNDTAARAVARTIATSPLVKTAFFGKDPNWGRILAAAGRAGIRFDPARAEIDIGDIAIVRGGRAVEDTNAEAWAHEVMRRPAYSVTVRLGRGRGRARYFACDLGHGYVDCNASYRS